MPLFFCRSRCLRSYQDMISFFWSISFISERSCATAALMSFSLLFSFSEVASLIFSLNSASFSSVFSSAAPP